jgi:hypothetical protein
MNRNPRHEQEGYRSPARRGWMGAISRVPPAGPGSRLPHARGTLLYALIAGGIVLVGALVLLLAG